MEELLLIEEKFFGQYYARVDIFADHYAPPVSAKTPNPTKKGTSSATSTGGKRKRSRNVADESGGESGDDSEVPLKKEGGNSGRGDLYTAIMSKGEHAAEVQRQRLGVEEKRLELDIETRNQQLDLDQARFAAEAEHNKNLVEVEKEKIAAQERIAKAQRKHEVSQEKARQVANDRQIKAGIMQEALKAGKGIDEIRQLLSLLDGE